MTLLPENILVNLPDRILAKLRQFQVAPATRLLEILRSGQNAVDLSECGVGKTAHAAYVIARLQLPTLVVAPKIVLSAWGRMLAHFQTSASVIGYELLRTGKTPFGQWQHGHVGPRETYFQCQTCQLPVNPEQFHPCPYHPRGIHCLVTKKKARRLGHFIFSPAVKLLVFDEVHRTGGMDSLNADMLIAAKRQRILTLCLSATPACSPLGMRALGYLLGLHGDKESTPTIYNFFGWSRQYGCGKLPGLPGWRWVCGRDRQQEAMRQIGKEMLPHSVRLKIESIPDFPKRRIVAELYDVSSPEKIGALYAELAEPLAALAERQGQDTEHPLTQILRVRQKIELLKVPIFVELTQDEIAKGRTVVVFVNFRATQLEIAKRLECSEGIHGGNTTAERESLIQRYFADEDRILLIQSAAGGTGLDLPDKRGEFGRTGLVSPGFSAVEFRQICSRLHRENSQSDCCYKVVLAARTIEEKIKRALDAKLSNLAFLNDGDLMPDSESRTT